MAGCPPKKSTNFSSQASDHEDSTRKWKDQISKTMGELENVYEELHNTMERLQRNLSDSLNHQRNDENYNQKQRSHESNRIETERRPPRLLLHSLIDDMNKSALNNDPNTNPPHDEEETESEASVVSEVSEISEVSESLGDTDNDDLSPEPYYVKDEDVVVASAVPATPTDPFEAPPPNTVYDTSTIPEAFSYQSAVPAKLTDPLEVRPLTTMYDTSTIPKAVIAKPADDLEVLSTSTMYDNSTIAEPSVALSWADKSVSSIEPGITRGYVINCILVIIIICVAVSISVSSSQRKKKGLRTNRNQPPTQMLSTSQLTLININADLEKIESNVLMGYGVSLSSDGDTLAVGGYKTCHLYSYRYSHEHDHETENIFSTSGTWMKTFDLAEFQAVSANTDHNHDVIPELSYKTVVSLSSDGHHIAVSDMETSRNGLILNGAVMVFSNIAYGGEDGSDVVVPWYQRGSTISGAESFTRLGANIAITEDGKRLAVSTTMSSNNGYAVIFDFDVDQSESDWVEKMKVEDNYKYDGYMALSSNGQFFAVGTSSHIVVDIYELTTFTKLQTLLGLGANDYGHSMSFTHDGHVLAIGSWSIGVIHLYRFDAQKRKYASINTPISLENVAGLGHSVSFTANGEYLVAGAVSPPSRGIAESADMISEGDNVFVFRIGDDNEWEEVDMIEHDQEMYDKIGWSVSVSGSGDVFAFGAYGTGGEYGDGVGVYRSVEDYL